MAQIIINEVSSNYGYNVGTSSFCSVALPITASWGPAFEDPQSVGRSLADELEVTAFNHFPATQQGLEAFVATYRGPAANYRSAKDYSYQLAMTLLTAGYDLDVCRLCPGTHASATITTVPEPGDTAGTLSIQAKYPGTFGNNIVVALNKVPNQVYWNLIVYVVDSTGSRTAVENLTFVFDIDNSNDSILHIDEVESGYVRFVVDNIDKDNVTLSTNNVVLSGGADRAADTTAADMMDDAIRLAQERYDQVQASDITLYLAALQNKKASNPDVSTASKIRYMEWLYNAAFYTMDILTDKLAYTSSRLVMPGWDDQNVTEISGDTITRLAAISPLHAKMMEIAYVARCLTAFIDIPKSVPRSAVYNSSPDPSLEGYAQKISRYISPTVGVGDALFASHSAIFAPWGQYKYVGTSRNNTCPPSFLALMIQIAMIKNQSLQYEWAMPTTRKHNLKIGKLDYTVPKKMLDEWQTIEGTAINVIADIPDLGVSVWGNSTAYDVPVATYNALQNLSTRFLMNAVKSQAFKVGLSITFQYNNEEAYSKFFVGLSPILDTMRNVGAITAYRIEMAADLNGLDSVNLNSVIGTVTIWVAGVINNITIDLVALPAGTEAE